MTSTIALIILTSVLSSCRKEETRDTGTITGYDYRKCMCCGGWFVEIGDSIYRFDQFPEASSIDLDSITYPFDVWLDWNFKDPQCMGDEIVVTYLEEK